MYGPTLYRWFAALVVFIALPAAPQTQFASGAAPSVAADPASVAGDLPTTDALPAQKPALTPEQLGDIYEVRERFEAAVDEYAKVQAPTPAVWNKMGIAYQMIFDLKDAARCYNEALKLDPDNFSALNNLATVEDGLKDYSAGERLYRKSLRLQPNSALVYKNLGTNLLMQHEYERGFEMYQQALAIAPHIFDAHFGPAVNDPAPDIERGTANYFKARSCAQAGLTDCAIEYLRKAFDEGSATVKKVTGDENFDNLRSTPALKNLMAELQPEP